MDRSAPSGSKVSTILSNSQEPQASSQRKDPQTNEDDNDKDKDKEKDENSSCLDLSSFLYKESNNEIPNNLDPTNQVESEDLKLPAENLERKLGEASFQEKKREMQIRSKIAKICNAVELALLSLTDDEKNNSVENIQNILEKKLRYHALAHQISKDSHRHSCTDLIKLQNLQKFYNLKCELWAKCEFQNIRSGSSKDRVVAMLLEDLESSGKIIPSKTTIITHTSAVFTLALAVANIRQGKKYEIISILSDRVSKFKSTLLNHMNLKVICAPEEASDNRVSKECPSMMATFLQTKIKDSFILDPFQEPLSMETHYWWTGPELLTQFDDKIDMLVCGYETGGMISGLSQLLKYINEECLIIGADISGQLANPNEYYVYDPETVFIEDYAFPALSSVLQRNAADKWYKVPVKETFLKARELMLKEGIPVSASSGGVLFAALDAIRDYKLAENKDAKIVLVLDNSVLYTDFEFGSNDWLVNHNYLTHDDIEQTIWFHQIRIWRIPVNVPVTILNEFNAFAVYTMMTTNGIERVIVQNSDTKSILGVVAYKTIQQNIWNGTINSKTCIGDSMAVCKSFKTISIHCNMGSLLELLKTHVFAVLVQKQNVCSTQGQHEEEWLAGILNFEEIVYFITDLEQKHSEKFGANLAGGFCRPVPKNLVHNLIESSKIDPKTQSQKHFEFHPDLENLNDNSSGKCCINLDLTTLAQSIAPCFAETVVMNSSIPPHRTGSQLPRVVVSADSPGRYQPLSVYAPTSSDSMVSSLIGGTDSDAGEYVQQLLLSPGEQMLNPPSESFVQEPFIPNMNSSRQEPELSPQPQTANISLNPNSGNPNHHLETADIPCNSQVPPSENVVTNENIPEFTTIYALQLLNSGADSSNAQVTPSEGFNPGSLQITEISSSPEGQALLPSFGPTANSRTNSEPFDPSSLFSTIVSQPFTPLLPSDQNNHDALNYLPNLNTEPFSQTNVSSTNLISMDSTLVLSTAGSSSNIQIDTESDTPSTTESDMEVPFEYSSIRVNDLIIQAMYSGSVTTESLPNSVDSTALMSMDPTVAISNSSSYNFIEAKNLVLPATISDPFVPTPVRVDNPLPSRSTKPEPGTGAVPETTLTMEKNPSNPSPGSSHSEKSKAAPTSASISPVPTDQFVKTTSKNNKACVSLEPAKEHAQSDPPSNSSKKND